MVGKASEKAGEWTMAGSDEAERKREGATDVSKSKCYHLIRRSIRTLN
jgi:hypothetical protein